LAAVFEEIKIVRDLEERQREKKKVIMACSCIRLLLARRQTGFS